MLFDSVVWGLLILTPAWNDACYCSRLNRVLELALALEYVHGGSGLGTMMHRDLKSVSCDSPGCDMPYM